MREEVSILKICDEIIKNLESKETTKLFFKQDIDFFYERIKTWTQRKTRVGLIGITSSGKSTLLNSILGKELLPARIGPTSNVITIGEYGDKFLAKIIYQQGSELKEKIIKDNILEELTKFSDVKYSTTEEFKVKEIYVHSPDFKLSRDISVIDTPGLAAYGFDEHEEITFELGLPLMDAIIFLTTFRTYSDIENLKRIKQILTYGKPILLVQNMIDTIYPKYDKYGKIIKDVKEILYEHKQKFREQLKEYEIDNYQEMGIAQISSLEALKGNKDSSNISELYSYINELLKKLNENVNLQRVAQINTRVDQILTQLSSFKNKDNYFKFEEEHINNLTNQVVSIQEELEKKINEVSERIKYIDPKTISEDILKLNKKVTDVYKAQENVINFIQKLLKPINQELLGIIKDTNEKLFGIASELNLMTQDLNSDIYSYQEAYSFSIPVKAVTYTVKIKIEKDGIANTLLRFIGKLFNQDWGYVERSVNKTEIRIDEERTKIAIIEKLEQWEDWIKNAIEKLIINSENYFYKIRHELYRMSLNIQNKSFIELSQEDINYILDLIGNAKKIIETISDGKVKGLNLEELKEQILIQYKEIEIPSIFSYLIELASLQSFKPLYFLRDFALSKVNDANKIIIWGWDNEEIAEFVNLYFSDLLVEPIYADLSLNDIFLKNDKRLITINENLVEDQIYQYLNILKDKDIAYFLLIDISQSGFTKTKIMKSLLRSLNINKACWVAISINAVLNSNKLVEGFYEFQKLIKDSGLPCDFILAGDKDPFYSLFFAEAFYYFIDSNASIFSNYSKIEIKSFFEPFINKNEFKKNTLEYFLNLITKTKETQNYA